MKPIRVSIYDHKKVETHKDSFDSILLADAWINSQEEQYRPWNYAKEGEYEVLPEGAINYTEEDREIEPARIEEQYELDENGDQITDKIVQIVIPAKTKKVYVVPKQYEVVIKDLTNDIDYQNEIIRQKRKKRVWSY